MEAGNVISIVVLTRPQMKSSINIILVGLVSCDSILIVTSILMFGIKALRFAHSLDSTKKLSTKQVKKYRAVLFK